MWVVIYFFVLRPQRRQEKERQSRVESLKRGDRVRTRGGIVAPVVRLRDDVVVVALGGDRSVEVEVHKSYIDDVTPAEGASKGDGK
jgi:preprotein translocase subunit YajC